MRGVRQLPDDEAISALLLSQVLAAGIGEGRYLQLIHATPIALSHSTPFVLSLSKGKRRPFILRQAQDERDQEERIHC